MANCDWCGDDSEVATPATTKFTVSTMDGNVLDYVCLCDECCKRGVTWNGVMVDAKD